MVFHIILKIYFGLGWKEKKSPDGKILIGKECFEKLVELAK